MSSSTQRNALTDTDEPGTNKSCPPGDEAFHLCHATISLSADVLQALFYRLFGVDNPRMHRPEELLCCVQPLPVLCGLISDVFPPRQPVKPNHPRTQRSLHHALSVARRHTSVDALQAPEAQQKLASRVKLSMKNRKNDY